MSSIELKQLERNGASWSVRQRSCVDLGAVFVCSWDDVSISEQIWFNSLGFSSDLRNLHRGGELWREDLKIYGRIFFNILEITTAEERSSWRSLLTGPGGSRQWILGYCTFDSLSTETETARLTVCRQPLHSCWQLWLTLSRPTWELG